MRLLIRFFLFTAFIFFTFSAMAFVTQVPQVTIKKAALEELSDSLSYPARVESRVNARIVSEADGIVSKIVAPLGTRVKRNGHILIIKHTDPIYKYAPLILVSPVNGIVSQVNVTEGASVTKGQELASVTDPDQIRILIEVAAVDLQSIKTGQQGELTVSGREGGDDKHFRVKVKGISPFVDPATGTATCELALEAVTALPPGSVGQVAFKVNSRKSFIFPDYAVIYRGDDTFVHVIRDGHAHQVNVKLGRKQRGQVEILSGVNAGDVVIERSSGFIADGAKVQVQN